MHRHPWRIVRALRVLIACLMLLLPAAPASARPAVADTVLVVAYAAAARDVPRASVEAPAPLPETDLAKPAFAVFTAAPAPRPAASEAVFVEDRWLLHCALLC